MPSNPLTREAGLKLGPIVLGTLVKHYLDKVTRDAEEKSAHVPLRKDELLYDEVFHIVKAFMSQASTKHTVEELQSFSNTTTPSPPWVHVVRLVVPMSSCDEAAKYLIDAFGGEDVMKRAVGGIKWWQIRGVRGVSAEWIVAKKDIDDARKQTATSSAQTRSGKKKSFSSRFGGQRSSTASSTAGADDENASENVPEMGHSSTTLGSEGASYQPEMDDMKCILYFHGGGYYFGSVDQERYSIQRFARKIHGRVFAINYRLAPQYPFPCAVQDTLAAYLFLTRPPTGAAHRPVPPSSIVIAGDSAGGGLSLALLQVLRDAGLPLPAGGVLISPWCDFTHSFPSIYANTATDIIPVTGLSLHKPSALWPPPSDEVTSRVRNGLRRTVHDVFRRDKHKPPKTPEAQTHAHPQAQPAHPRAQAHAQPQPQTQPQLQTQRQAQPQPQDQPHVDPQDPSRKPSHLNTEQNNVEQTQLSPALESAVSLGIVRSPADQLQLYASNDALTHPLVSPALSYLGGLPPLLFIASDREVLRDEVIYTAHKAADPEAYPVQDSVKAMYPAFQDLEGKMTPTAVHLQVYDDAAHVLPILFPFTTPAKYCFRAVATFCKHVTASSPTASTSISNTSIGNSSTSTNASTSTNTPTASSPEPVLVLPATYTPSPITSSPKDGSFARITSSPDHSSISVATMPPSILLPSTLPSETASTASKEQKTTFKEQNGGVSKEQNGDAAKGTSNSAMGRTKSLHARPRASLSTAFSRAASFSGRSARAGMVGAPHAPPLKSRSEDVGGPRKPQEEERPKGDVFAGEAVVYDGGWARGPGPHLMLRERVSTQGLVRPLEPPIELPAFQLPPADVGKLPEAAVTRYANGKAKLDKKFARTIARIAEHRRRNLERAKQDVAEHVARLEHYLTRQEEGQAGAAKLDATATATWSLAWAFDADERPPPSSIVARRDTAEAIELARVADQALFASEKTISGNNLWGMVLNFFTVTPDKGKEKEMGKGEHGVGKQHVVGMGRERERRRRRSTIGAFWKGKVGGHGQEKTAEPVETST